LSLLLDAGALIAFERGSRTVQAFLERAQRAGEPVRTTTTVIAQVFRKPAAQVALTRLLRGVDEQSLDGERARKTGALLSAAECSDVVDGSLVEAARDGDEILTSDPDDILALATAAKKTLIVTRV
jgi:predicted nucleic acid-binding protein